MKRIWNKFTDIFGLTIFHPQFLMLNFNNEAVVAAQKYAHGQLVDIGCGRMPYRERIEPLVEKYIGVDHPETSKLYKNSKFKPEIYADAEKLPIKNNSIDTVLMLQVLEYLKNPVNTFLETERIMKPKAVLILSIPFMYPIHDGNLDRNRYTPSAISEMIKDSKLKLIKITIQGGFWDFWLQSFLVFYFKRAMEISRGKTYQKLFSIMLILFGLSLTPCINMLAILTDKIATYLPKFENDFPINILLIAKK